MLSSCRLTWKPNNPARSRTAYKTVPQAMMSAAPFFVKIAVVHSILTLDKTQSLCYTQFVEERVFDLFETTVSLN